MSRGLTADQLSALRRRRKTINSMMRLDLDSGPVTAWDGSGDLVYGGLTYIGVGLLASISGVSTERGIIGQEISLTLSGLPTEGLDPRIVKDAKEAKLQDRPLLIQMSVFDPDVSGLMLCEPWPWWEGVADVLQFQLGETLVTTLLAENYSSRLRRRNGYRCTTENHNARLAGAFPRDNFFSYNVRLNAKGIAVL